MSSYWFTSRPDGLEHGHPFLVFDCQDRLHLPLTVFGKEANARLSPKTAQTYLYSILPWFTCLETDVWQVPAGIPWNPPTLPAHQPAEHHFFTKLHCNTP